MGYMSRVLPISLIMNKKSTFVTYYNTGSGVNPLNRSNRAALIRRTGWRPTNNGQSSKKCKNFCSYNFSLNSASNFKKPSKAPARDNFTINDFLGNWSGFSPHFNSNGTGITIKQVNLDSSGNCSNIYYINGTITWTAEKSVGNNPMGTAVKTDSEQILGLYMSY